MNNPDNHTIKPNSGDIIRIRRAIISVSDKTGIISLARILHQHDVELISTGGTASILKDSGLPVTDVSKLTGYAEAFGGRVKTLSFEIAASLLYNRQKDAEEAASLGILPVDLLVCNLYPYEAALRMNLEYSDLIEHIDIGGVTLIRSAAKNSEGVTVLVDPSDYDEFTSEFEHNNGCISINTRRKFMCRAFNHTADYDSIIARSLDEHAGICSYRLSYNRGQQLRYGENPHQKARLFLQSGTGTPFTQIRGRELSYTNILDLHAAVSAAFSYSNEHRPCVCAVVKHGNACGLAAASTNAASFQRAWHGDPVSAFGSVIAFSHHLDLETIKSFNLTDKNRSKRRFIEIVAAPSFEEGAVQALSAQRSLRMIQWHDNPLDTNRNISDSWKYSFQMIGNMLLMQEADYLSDDMIQSATSLPFPEDSSFVNLGLFGIHAVTRIISNAIVIVRHTGDMAFQLLGMGAGQPNRVTSVRLAVDKARENLIREINSTDEGRPSDECNNGCEANFTKERIDTEEYIRQELQKCILVSDAFFPFPDSVDACAEAGIRHIIQPGGSRKDREVIDRADELGISMALNGYRHFRH